MENNYWADNPTFVIRDKFKRYMGMCAITQVSFLAGNYEVGYQQYSHLEATGCELDQNALIKMWAFDYGGSKYEKK